MKRKIYSFFTLTLTLVFCAFCLVGCKSNGEGKVVGRIVETTEETVVILVEETDGSATLFDVMEELRKNDALSYGLSGTMVKEINGKQNAADFSACWMLYTSDSEMGNLEWGTYEYEDVSCVSAIVGGDALNVVAGEYYIWVFVRF